MGIYRSRLPKALFLAVVGLILLSAPAMAAREGLYHFNYLDSLKTTIRGLNGQTLAIWFVYSEPVNPADPDTLYSPVDAKEEGIACVDDISRIALAYLYDYEKTGNTNSLFNAKEAVEFLLYMQSDEGYFFNFIKSDNTINATSITSAYEGFSLWTARAIRALGKAYQVFQKIDPSFADEIDWALSLSVSALNKELFKPEHMPGTFRLIKGRMMPSWLPSDGGDISSIIVLGLLDYYSAKHDSYVKNIILSLCSGLASLRDKAPDRFPFGSFYTSSANPYEFHVYANYTAAALAAAGRSMNQKEWIKEAEGEANTFYPYLLATMNNIFGMSPQPENYPQIAHTTETLITNCMELYRVTGKKHYAIMAGLFASWFFGNNPLGAQVYRRDIGRCYDGIDKGKLNINAGAESTVCAILAMQSMEGTEAEKYIDARPADEKATGASMTERRVDASRVRDLRGKRLTERALPGGAKEAVLNLTGGESAEFDFELKPGENYLAYYTTRVSYIGAENPRDTLRLSLSGGKSEFSTGIHTFPLYIVPEMLKFEKSVRFTSAGVKAALQFKSSPRTDLYFEGFYFLPIYVQKKFKAGTAVITFGKSFDSAPRTAGAKKGTLVVCDPSGRAYPLGAQKQMKIPPYGYFLSVE